MSRKRAVVCLLVVLSLAGAARAEDSGVILAPSYSTASIVNSATNIPGALAPNTIITIYGEHLSYNTRSLTAADVSNNTLPTMLTGTGVRVFISGLSAPVYYVSPQQINLLVPSNMIGGPTTLHIVRDGRAGPKVTLELRGAAPALYQLDLETAIAVRPDGSIATWDNPARPGEILVLYGTGLGETAMHPPPGWLPKEADWITAIDDFDLLLDGNPVARDHIFYVGVAPGFAGLYQLNVRLPATTGPNPEIRLVLGTEASPRGIRVPVAP